MKMFDGVFLGINKVLVDLSRQKLNAELDRGILFRRKSRCLIVL